MTETIRLKKKNHAYLQVETERSVEQELHEFFSFYVPGYKWMPAYKNRVWDGKINLYNLNTKEIYAGLYDYIVAFANAEGRQYRVIGDPDPVYGAARSTQQIDLSFVEDIPLSSKGNTIRPRDYQLSAVEHALSNKQSLLLSPTASGKSLIIYLICRWYLDNHDGRILIIVPTTSLVEQMYSDFGDYSTTDSDFNIEKAAHRIYGGQDKNNTDQRIVISTWQSIYKLPTSWFNEFGCVIGDEAHNFKAKSLTSVLTKCHNASYRFGTTGTLDGTQCFDGDTLVKTTRGDIKIKDVSKKDIVYTVDENTLEVQEKPVVKKYNNGTPKEKMLRIITDSDEEMILTESHHVMTERGWVLAKNLTDSDKLYYIA